MKLGKLIKVGETSTHVGYMRQAPLWVRIKNPFIRLYYRLRGQQSWRYTLVIWTPKDWTGYIKKITLDKETNLR